LPEFVATRYEFVTVPPRQAYAVAVEPLAPVIPGLKLLDGLDNCSVVCVACDRVSKGTPAAWSPLALPPSVPESVVLSL